MPTIQIASFGGVSALPIRAAQAQGLFDQAGIEVEHTVTRSSGDLRAWLADGAAQIIHLAPDNVIAWADDGLTVCAWLGGSNGPISLVGIDATVTADLRGRRIGVDSPRSGFVTILRSLLERADVAADEVTLVELGATRLRYQALLDHSIDATMLTLPWSRLAEGAGATVLADQRQAAPGMLTSCAASLTGWLEAEPSAAAMYADVLSRSIARLRDGGVDEATTALLAESMEIDLDTAGDVLGIMADPALGWPTDLWLSAAALEPTLKLRALTMGPATQPARAYVAEPFVV